MRKLVQFVLTLTLISGMIAALAPNHRIAAQSDPVEVRIFVGISTGVSESQRAVQDALAEEWNSTHDDIKIVFEYQENNVARDVLTTQIAGGNPPDIVGPIGITGIYQFKDLWLDLAPYIEADADELALDEYDANVLRLYEQAGGQNLSIALGIYPSFMWVNEDLFAAAEVPLPPTEFGAPYVTRDGEEMPWDWEAVAVVARQITQDANGLYGDEEGFDADNTVVWGYSDIWGSLRSAAARFGATTAGVAEDGLTPTFNEDAYVNALDWNYRAVFEGQFAPDQAEGDAVTAGTSPFESGKIGMWYSHSWYNCCMAGATFDWGTYAAPAVPGTNGEQIVAPLHADTYAIPQGTDNPEAAWEVLKWLNSAPVASQLCEAFGCMPARTTARQSWEENVAANIPNFDVAVLEAAAAHADVPNHESYLPGGTAAVDAINAVWNNIRVDPEMDAAAALEELNTNLQNIFNEAAPSS